MAPGWRTLDAGRVRPLIWRGMPPPIQHADPSPPPVSMPGPPRASTRARLQVAAVGAAASAGVLVGVGARDGAPGALLSAAGDRLRGVPAVVAPDRALGASAAIGLAHHLVLALAWGTLFARVAHRVRGGRRVAAALLVAGTAAAADLVLPAPFALAAGAGAPAQRAVVALALAAGLVAGMRFAQRSRGSATHVAVPSDRH